MEEWKEKSPRIARIRRQEEEAERIRSRRIVYAVAVAVCLLFGILAKIDGDHAERLKKAEADAMAQCIEDAHGDLDACEWEEKRDRHGDLYEVEVIRKK